MKNKKSDNKKTVTFIGLSKKELLVRMGDDFNFYPDKVWTYVLKKYWWGHTRKLYLEFDEEDKVISQYTLYTYEK
ncbi:MAG: hypothetical protein QM564_05050 [Bergeyella sp.]